MNIFWVLFTLAFCHPQIVQKSVTVRSRDQELAQVVLSQGERALAHGERLMTPTAEARDMTKATVCIKREQLSSSADFEKIPIILSPECIFN